MRPSYRAASESHTPNVHPPVSRQDGSEDTLELTPAMVEARTPRGDGFDLGKVGRWADGSIILPELQREFTQWYKHRLTSRRRSKQEIRWCEHLILEQIACVRHLDADTACFARTGPRSMWEVFIGMEARAVSVLAHMLGYEIDDFWPYHVCVLPGMAAFSIDYDSRLSELLIVSQYRNPNLLRKSEYMLPPGEALWMRFEMRRHSR